MKLFGTKLLREHARPIIWRAQNERDRERETETEKVRASS
jgi:hypothetical protein